MAIINITAPNFMKQTLLDKKTKTNKKINKETKINNTVDQRDLADIIEYCS
jgi:hypothetical protein